MCGIVGASCPNQRQVVVTMSEVLVHRGPDGHGYYHGDDISLAQRRLSIIDLEGGQQPIPNETGSLQLVCNGEIYNSPELREQLIRLGHTFRTKTDVEVILHLYEEYGPECVKHLRGMFAFALWNKREKSLFLARDHLGQKPLFFYWDGTNFLFASEVKSILASGVVNTEMDLEGVWHYMSLRFMPDQYTLFKGVRKLPAATSLLLKDGQLKFDHYWSLNFLSKLPSDARDIEDGLDAVLRETVEMHLLSDVRVGAFLSGGIDSTTIAAIMASMSEGRIPTFSIGVEEQGFNELPFSRMVAKKYNFEAHERVVRADLVHLMPAMIYHLDEPADPFGVGVYLVSQIASEVVKVALSGDGADESFAGYDRYAGQKVADYYCLLPAWMRRTVLQKIVDRIPESFGYKSIAQKARWVQNMSFYSHGDRYAQSMSFLRFTQEAKDQLFTARAKEKIGDYNSIDKILCHFNAENVNDLVDRMLYTDLMTRIPDHNMVIGDRMSMAHSLEVRSPFVDYKLVEYAASIPGHIKLKSNKLKHILRRVAARYLPSELVNRQKQGFGFPIGMWMRTDLRSFLQKLFAESRFVESGVFDDKYVIRILEEHLSGRVDHNYRLWILLNLEFWHRLYFEGESIQSMRDYTERLMRT